MLQLAVHNLKTHTETSSNFPVIDAIKITCSCRKDVIVPVVRRGTFDYVIHSKGNCPNCAREYIVMAFIGVNEGGNYIVSRVFIDPNPFEMRLPILLEKQMGDERLYKAYLNALDTYNKGAIVAVPSVTGRALEGMIKVQLKDEPELNDGKVRMLGNLLQLLPERVDLGRPILDLAKALTESRNVGTHFDLFADLDPTPEMAEKMLDLLEVIIEYLYLMPAQVQELKNFVSTKQA